jgi:PhzF family phenazine biosynthesis protein
MRRLRLKQVDVFTTTRLCGNPAAVVLDAAGLGPEVMQAIAREMNLSETTFVSAPTRPDADYRVRIFTPRAELPFAGHPTIATAFALVEDGRLRGALVRQECGIGVVPLVVEPRPDGPFFMMTQAEPAWRTAGLEPAACAGLLGCGETALLDAPAEIVSTGVPWIVFGLRDVAAVRALRPDSTGIEALSRERDAAGVTVFCLAAEDARASVRLRTFAPLHGIAEDPVCGSGNGAVAAYVARHGLLPGPRVAYVAEQGVEIARPGLVSVEATRGDGGRWTVRVGGQAVTVLEGELVL